MVSFAMSLLFLQSTKEELARIEDKLAETLAGMQSVEADLAAQTKRTEGLQDQVQLAQDRVAEARAATAAADVDLRSAEQRVAELTNSLDTAEVNHDQAVTELQQQHSDERQVCPHTVCSILLQRQAV